MARVKEVISEVS